MANFAGTGRIVLSGSLGQGEVFSTGFWVTGSGPTSAADAQAKMNTFFSEVVAGPLDRLRALIDANSAYTRMRLYWYNLASPAPATYIVDAVGGAAAGTGTGSHPQQTAIVASLRSQTLGRGGRGRMYLPANAADLGAHELSQTSCTNLANAVAAILDSGAKVGGTAGDAIVNSQSLGQQVRVARVIVDSRPDIQRRRADAQTVLFTATAAR